MSIIEKGTILAFCGGSYSDKWTTGPFNVLKDIDQKEIVNDYLSQFVKNNEWDEPSEGDFYVFLHKNGYVEDVDKSYRWYMGDWDFDPETDV